jgi:hypothetical protein
VRQALRIWLLTRLPMAVLAVAGSWLLTRGTAAVRPGFLELWDRWDVRVFVKIAQFGYLGYPRDYPDTGTAAFFPGLPGALWLAHLVTSDWVVAGLVVSLVAGGVAAVALARLAAADPRAARLVELRFFLGLTLEEAAACLGLSERTAYRHWAYARAWLRRELDRAPDRNA